MAVPVGVIALWSGLLANIPANWVLCDGTGGTPDLVARFVRGAPAATEPGTTGGADSHTHASMTAAGAHTHALAARTHTHVVNSSGSHLHGANTLIGTGGSTGVMYDWTGEHSHTTTTGTSSHTHTSGTAATHTHPISTDDGRPPYYEVAFIQAGAGAAVAANLIIIWTGTLASIPAGWSLCDGGGGRPDLRTRFVRGVNTNVTNPGTTGGTATHIHTETAGAHTHPASNSTGAHTHGFSAYTWTHSHNISIASAGTDRVRQTDTYAGNHTHATSNSTGAHTHTLASAGSHAHTVDATSSLPAYYDVAYIINDGGATAIPLGGILIWTGLLANIPSDYNQCDGNGGRPNLLGKFIRGSAAGIDPGGTGGSDTHTHTDQNNATHSDHTVDAGGAHQHSATDSIGAHTHTTSLLVLAGTDVYVSPNQSTGAHSHTYNNEDSHTNHTVGAASAVHNHNPWSTNDGRPAYYEVIFIWAPSPVIVYDETGKEQVILAAQGETETVTRLETAREQVILVAQGEADIQAMSEVGKEQTILGVLTAADIQAMVETGKEVPILAVIGEADGWLYIETGKEQVILAVLGESETLALLETARLQVVLAVLDEADVQTMQELGITQIVLVVAGEVEAATYPELGRLQEILSVIDETDTQAMAEAREQIIKFVLESADTWAMVESLEQLILAVVGKEEGRLLKSKRTTGKARVLDSIREEGVERVLDSDVVPH